VSRNPPPLTPPPQREGKRVANNPTARPKLVTAVLEDSLEKLIEEVNFTGIHRVFVVDKENKPLGCLSLCDLIKNFC
jgi:hypothetical protein